MFKFCLLFAGVAFLEKLDTIVRQKTAHFKAKNVLFNWIACAILSLKMSTYIVPLEEIAIWDCLRSRVHTYLIQNIFIFII